MISGQRWLQGKKGQSKNEEDTFEEVEEEQDSFLFGALNEELDDENTEEIRKLKVCIMRVCVLTTSQCGIIID